MKKIQIVLIIGILFSSVITKVIAQSAENNVGNNQGEIFTSFTEDNTPESKSLARVNKASSKALNNFKRTFNNDQDAKWFVEPKVVVATFTKNDIKTKAVYDKKGNRRYTMQTYQENKMPQDIRSLVKRSIYFDYSIELVQQVQEGDITVYIVHLKNGKKYKQISVYEGDINVIQEFEEG